MLYLIQEYRNEATGLKEKPSQDQPISKIDIDQLRTNYNSKRPELAHILREKFRRSGKRNPNPGMKDGFMKGGDKRASWSRGQGGGGVKKSFKKSNKKRD